MSILCGCPRGAEIPDVPISSCVENFGQIQKIILQRVWEAPGTKNLFVPNAASSPTDPTLKATWTPLLAAADDTKVVQSPFITNPETEPGAAKTFGGGNATLNGIELIVGTDPTAFKSLILQTKQDAIAALKKFQCEEVGVFFVDEFGAIAMDSNGEEATSQTLELYPFPIKSLFVGDKKFGGFEEPDSNALEFKLLPNWSDNFTIITPSDFNALTDLVTP